MERRLDRLTQLWPPVACATCAARPALICIAREDDPAPSYPEGRCPACGRMLYTVPVLIGIRDDQI